MSDFAELGDYYAVFIGKRIILACLTMEGWRVFEYQYLQEIRTDRNPWKE